ncbi:MAG: ABC transporter ATP-binding protein [Patescibacteria group bacterium]|nr:ABC transporter ATP-binding protein [Patescibacteria group bacterium]
MLIKIRDLKKEFNSGDVVTRVLHGVSFDIDKGEFVSIMGPSGSGKSTLMHILGLLDRLSDGSYEFDGQNVNELDDDQLAGFRNKKIGFVFQSFNLLPKTSVLDNVILPLTYSDNRKNMGDRAKKVLDSVGLGHRLNYYTNQISGGEKQRVAIARALVNNPSVIFADEPTGNLDSKSGTQIMNILQKLNEEGNTIILVTHETFTAEHAKRIIRVKDGLILSDEVVKNRRFAKEAELLK